MANRKISSFDRIKSHLDLRGETVAVSRDMEGDLDAVVRRCDEVRSLRQEYGTIELSPYMLSLLHVSSALPREEMRANSAVVASV